jgi:DNA-binding MarR family transcriptional regulator
VAEAHPTVATQHAVRRLVAALIHFDGTQAATLARSLDDHDLAHGLPVLAVLAIAEHGELRPAQIGTLTGLTSGGVTGLIERLESAGVIERSLGMVPGDRRGVLVTLTAKGETVARQMVEAMLTPSADTDRDLAELHEALEGFRAARREGRA